MKLYLVLSAVVLLLIAGAFFAGRYTAPADPQATQERLATIRQVVVTVYKDRVTARHVHTVAVVTPDGGSVTTTDETEHTEEHVAEIPPPVKEVVPLIAAVTAPKAQWQLGPSIGLTFGSDRRMTVVYGGELDFRPIGPFWIGLRINTAPYAGATLKVEF